MRWLITLSLWLLAAPLQAQTLEALVHTSPRCPSVQKVQREALRHHHLDGPVDPWTGRARWSNAIPQLDAEVRWLDQHDDRADYREDLGTGAPGVGLLAPDDIRQQFVSGSRTQRVWRLRARVELGKLLFDPREVQIAAQTRQLVKARQEVLHEVTRRYHARMKHQLQLAITSPDDIEVALKLWIALQEDTAMLDALTGGWFTQQRCHEVQP